MATRTSTQSGNFNSTATWGGAAVPVDGDQFIISAGHTVTLSDDRRPTTGYGDSTVFGKMIITGTGKLRMNGTLYIDMTASATKHFVEGDSASGAYFQMQNASILEIRGDNAAVHRLQINAEPWITCEIDGDTPNSKTTFSSAVFPTNTSIPATSSTGFAAGDWISMHIEAEDVDDWEMVGSLTEGAIIHAISGNTIYPRHFVSPTAIIQAASGTSLTVDEASVFRVGYKIIFGTGSNLNIKTISAIDGNTITIDSSITGTVVGETIYQTGIEKYHAAGHTIQKVATPITADASSGQAIINVASTAGMTNGTRIWIESNSISDTAYDYQHVYTISSISGNQITLTTNLVNAREEGAWVAIYDRATQVKSVDVGNSNERPFVWSARYVTNYNKRLRFRNVLFEGLGTNTSSTYYGGVCISGYHSYENNSFGYYSSMEGCVYSCNYRSTYAGVTLRDVHQFAFRNNLLDFTERGLWFWSSMNNSIVTNNISSRATYTTYTFDTFYEPRAEFSYNLATRSDDYGLIMNNRRDALAIVRQNYFTNNRNRPFYIYYNGNNHLVEKCVFNRYRYWPFHGHMGGDVIYLNCKLSNDWDSTGSSTVISGVYIQDDDYPRPGRDGGDAGRSVAINYDFKKDVTVDWGQYCLRTWDKSELAWFIQRSLSTNAWAGKTFGVYVPAGSTVYLGASIKLTDGFSGNLPYFRAYKAVDFNYGAFGSDGVNATENSTTVADSYPIGFYEQTQFSASAIGAYEQKTLTVQPQNHDYYLAFAVFSDNSNAGNGSEGWWEREIKVTLSEVSTSKRSKILGRFKFNTGDSLTTGKTRLGGRLA